MVCMTTMTIDCARCVAPVGSCDDCVVAAMLGVSGLPTLNNDERAALEALAASKLLPPLRLETFVASPSDSCKGVAA